jgi:hypothetical protein
MSELIECGPYKLYQGLFEGEFYRVVIKMSFRCTLLVKADKEVPVGKTVELIAAMLNDGQLCDSYMSKKHALKDLELLSVHNFC